jgi:hypothetical protein
MNASFVYQGFKFSNHAVDLIAGGWSPSFLVSYNNGYPFTPLTGTDDSLTGIGLDRPNKVSGVNPYLRGPAVTKGIQWLNTAAFTANGPGTFGTTGMNSLLQPHYIDSDVSVRKLFRTFREQNFELRWQFFNIFNHPNLSAPVNSITNTSFGYIQAAGTARIMQIAGKYTF